MNENLTLLNTIFNNTSMSSKTLGAILPKIENNSLRRAVISQIEEYDKINKSAGEEICALGEKPRVKNPIKEKMIGFNAALSIESNPSNSHIAKMITKGSNTGIIDITSAMNACLNSSPKVYNLARLLSATEEANLKKMKPFL